MVGADQYKLLKETTTLYVFRHAQSRYQVEPATSTTATAPTIPNPPTTPATPTTPTPTPRFCAKGTKRHVRNQQR